MNFHILTVFPEIIGGCLNHSILARAMERGLLSLNTVHIREFAKNKHRNADDYPFGGGAGMVMMAEPIYLAYKSLEGVAPAGTRVVYLTPQGRVFNQKIAEELSRESDLILLCGHYEGVDERVIEEIVTDEISLGDFVLTGGELAAAVLVDATARLIPGVLHNADSAAGESFSLSADGEGVLLEYPQYTRPRVFLGREVPEILLSGHHANIKKWRMEQAEIRTAQRRPDLRG